MINSKGRNTSAIYGFTSALLDILRKERPEYMGVVFDPPSPTFRNLLYSEYKANRLQTPEEIRKSVPVIKAIVTEFGIPVIEYEGFEADDVIGTLAKNAEKDGMVAYMVTPDKDYTQLVSDSIFIYKPSRTGKGYDIVGVPEVQNTFGIERPEQVIDILALWGDASDNIPGAPGIGEKTAKELISRYKNLENLFEHRSELKPKQQESLTEHEQQVLLSQQLARIHTEVPVTLSWEELKARPWNDRKLKEVFNELEFRSLIPMITSVTPGPVQGDLFKSGMKEAEPVESGLGTVETVAHQYEMVQDDAQVAGLVEMLVAQEEVCFDTETTGLKAREAELVGMSFCCSAHKAYYLPFPVDRDEASRLLNRLKPFFSNRDILKIGQNLKYDIQILMNYQVEVEGPLFDTMIAHYLIQPDLNHNMDFLAEVYLQYRPVPITALIGTGAGQMTMRDVELEKIKEYAAEDADVTWQLYQVLKKELEKRGLVYLAEKVEMPLVRVLAELEYAGFKISIESLHNYSDLLKKEIHGCEAAIYEMAQGNFNISSPKQLGEVLFDKMKISEGAQKTKTNQYSTGEEVLIKLKDKHPIIGKILDYRAMQKLLNTYVDALPEMIDKKTDKVHTSFEQAWVSTGRLSSKNPNLQNIPIRDERGKEIRKAFIPSDERHMLLSADYSQIELRLMAHLSNDAQMIGAFLHHADIHTSTAAKIFNVPEHEVTSSQRSKAKTANFGIIYGISAFGLSQRLNIPRGEAAALIQGYFESFPQVREYMNHAIRIAKEQGYVETLMGRRRYLPDIHSGNAVVRGVAERNAINAPIQGSAADVIKLAMVRIQEKLRQGYHTKMILQVHDELIFDVVIEEIEAIRKLVKSEMEHAVELRVPLIVDIGTGNNWLEAH
jgi:DNA polymerase-1